MPHTETAHRRTLRLPLPVWNAVKLKAIQKGENYTATITKALRVQVGEVADLSKIEVNADA